MILTIATIVCAVLIEMAVFQCLKWLFEPRREQEYQPMDFGTF